MTKPNLAEQLEQTIQTWISEGRSEEQIYGVRNFFTGVGAKFISNLLIQEREAGKDEKFAEAVELMKVDILPGIRQQARTETIKEVIEKLRGMTVLLHIDEKRGDNIGVGEEWGNGFNGALHEAIKELEKL